MNKKKHECDTKKAHSALTITPIQHSTPYIQHHKPHQPVGTFRTHHSITLHPKDPFHTLHYKPLSDSEIICVYLLRRRRNLCVNPSFRMASVQICAICGKI